MLQFIILDCSLTYCKRCTGNTCSECISPYYFYEDITCNSICDTNQGYFVETISGSLYCKSKFFKRINIWKKKIAY